ncbi:MAG TPA: hypothetical protein VEZ49_08100 [Gemmatimonadales bacterium]|nr:hypothetical protein [Gemmatimonadales bacterium]
MNEDRLNQLARRLGANAAERLDVEATARQVVQRLREQPARRGGIWTQQTWVRIAATVVILVGGAVAVSRLAPGRRTGVSPAHAHLVADDLRDLSAQELRDVLMSFDEIVASDSVVVPESGTDLNELDTQQLRALLRSPEG